MRYIGKMHTDLGRCLIGHTECPVLDAMLLDVFCIAVKYSLVDSIDSSSLRPSQQPNSIAISACNNSLSNSRIVWIIDYTVILKKATVFIGVSMKSCAGKIKFFSNLYKSHLHQTSQVCCSIVYAVKYPQVK